MPFPKIPVNTWSFPANKWPQLLLYCHSTRLCVSTMFSPLICLLHMTVYKTLWMIVMQCVYCCRLVTQSSDTVHILCQSSVRVELSRHDWHHVSLTYTEKSSARHADVQVSSSVLSSCAVLMYIMNLQYTTLLRQLCVQYCAKHVGF